MAVVDIKVEASRPEDSPERLAVRLAEEMSGMTNASRDRAALYAQSRQERLKAQDLGLVIDVLKERVINPPTRVSRMDPYETYDLAACEAERAEYLERAEDLQRQATECEERRRTCERSAAETQSALSKARRDEDGIPN